MPLMIALLSFCILHEGLKVREIVALILSFGGMICLILGRPESVKTTAGELEVLALLLLVLGTFLTSLGFIFLRQMKETHWVVVPTYLNFFSFLTSFLIMKFEGKTLQFMSTFDKMDYFLLVLVGFFSCYAQVFKTMSLHYETASRVSIVQYTDSVLQFIFDLLIIKSHWTDI